MAEDYPTTVPCGIAGKTCAIAEYPQCDGRDMVGLRPLPDDPPKEEKELSEWADKWVESVKSFAGICRYASGNWGIYYGQRPSTVLEQPASFATAPSQAPADEPPQGDVPFQPAAVSYEAPESFSLMPFIESVRKFGEGLIPEKYKKETAIGGGAFAAALALALGTWAIVRSRRKPKPEAAALPLAGAVKPESIEAARKMQRMISVHRQIKDISWYGQLDPQSRLVVLRTFSSGRAIMLGLRPGQPDSEKRVVIMSRESFVDGEPAVVVQDEHGVDQAVIMPAILSDPVKEEELARDYEQLLDQIRNLRDVSSFMDLRAIDDRVLARALLFEKSVIANEGGWEELQARFLPCDSGLKGPVPPDWILQSISERGVGINGRGDPFPERPADDSGWGKTRSTSTFWTQLITSEWFQGMDHRSQAIILGNQPALEPALKSAYRNRPFNKRFVVEGSSLISDEGLMLTVLETFKVLKINPRQSPGLAALRGLDEKNDASWLSEFRRDFKVRETNGIKGIHGR